MKLLLDEQVTYKVAEALRDRAHDVTAVAEIPSLRGLSDRDVFDLAKRQQRAVVTYNVVDFIEILREVASSGEEHWGLVLVNSKRLPNSDIGGLIAALDALLANPPRESAFVTWLQPAA